MPLSPVNQIEITVDRALCIGSGDCVDTAPDVFQLDDVIAAAGNCPVAAIFVVGESGDLYP